MGNATSSSPFGWSLLRMSTTEALVSATMVSSNRMAGARQPYVCAACLVRVSGSPRAVPGERCGRASRRIAGFGCFLGRSALEH